MSEYLDADGDPLPETLVLKPHRVKWLFVFLIAAGFVAIAVWLGPNEDPAVFWGAGGFFLFCAMIALTQMSGIGSSLSLDGAGFTVRTLFKSHSRTWAECSPFEAVSVGMRGSVCYSTARDVIAHPRVAGMARGLTGHTAALPDTYGLSADELAELMNAFRARALAFSTPRNPLPN